jgi:hypothetical protein
MKALRIISMIAGTLLLMFSIYEGSHNEWAHATYDLVLGIWMLKE